MTDMRPPVSEAIQQGIQAPVTPAPVLDENGNNTVGLGKPAAATVIDPVAKSRQMLYNFGDQQAKAYRQSLSPELAGNLAIRPDYMSANEARQASRYTENGQTYLRGRDNEAVAAAYQDGQQKWNNNLKAFSANFFGSVAATPFIIPQLVKTAASMIRGDSSDKVLEYFRGEPGSIMHDIDEWMRNTDEKAVNFGSNWGRDHPIANMLNPFGSEGGNDFGSLSRSAGFMLGGLATTTAELAIGTLLSPITEGLSFTPFVVDTTSKLNRLFKGLSTIGKNLDTISDAVKLEQKTQAALQGVKNANIARQIWSGMDTPLGKMGLRSSIHDLLVNNGEASMEGYNRERDSYQEFVDGFITTHGYAPNEGQKEQFKLSSRKAGNATYIANLALLSLTNRIPTAIIFKNFPGASSIFGDLGEGLYRLSRKTGSAKLDVVRNTPRPLSIGTNTKWYEKGLSIAAGAGSRILTPLAIALPEGFEESLQSGIQTGTHQYYTYVQNHQGRDDLGEAFKAAQAGFTHAFATKEGWTEFLGGVVMAGLFEGGINGIKNHFQKSIVKNQLQQLADQLNDGTVDGQVSMPTLQQAIINQVTQTVSGNNLTTKAGHNNAQLTGSVVGASAAAGQDQLIFQNQKNTLQFSFLHPIVQQGSGDVLREQFKTYREDIQKDPVAFADAFNIDSSTTKQELEESIQQLEDKLTELEKSHQNFKGLYRNPYKAEIIKLQKQGKPVDLTLMDNNHQWDQYYAELLHNDFLRKQYAKRIQKLDINSPLLAGDNPYISQLGWDKHRKTLQANLDQLDDILNQSQKAIHDSHDPATSGPLDALLDKNEKQVLANQKTQRDTLTRRISAIDGLIKNKFSDYDQVLNAVKQDLLSENPDSIDPNITNAELEKLLQNSFDAYSLRDSIRGLGEQFNKLTSKKGFEDFQAASGRYQIIQSLQTVQQQIQQRQDLQNWIDTQFTTSVERNLHLGSLTDVLNSYSDEFGKDPDAVKQKLQAIITQSRQDKQQQQDQIDKLHSDLLLYVSTAIPMVQANLGNDPGHAILTRVVDEVIAANPTETDIINLGQLFEAAYAQALQPQSTSGNPVANTTTITNNTLTNTNLSNDPALTDTKLHQLDDATFASVFENITSFSANVKDSTITFQIVIEDGNTLKFKINGKDFDKTTISEKKAADPKAGFVNIDSDLYQDLSDKYISNELYDFLKEFTKLASSLNGRAVYMNWYATNVIPLVQRFNAFKKQQSEPATTTTAQPANTATTQPDIITNPLMEGVAVDDDPAPEDNSIDNITPEFVEQYKHIRNVELESSNNDDVIDQIALEMVGKNDKPFLLTFTLGDNAFTLLDEKTNNDGYRQSNDQLTADSTKKANTIDRITNAYVPAELRQLLIDWKNADDSQLFVDKKLQPLIAKINQSSKDNPITPANTESFNTILPGEYVNILHIEQSLDGSTLNLDLVGGKGTPFSLSLTKGDTTYQLTRQPDSTTPVTEKQIPTLVAAYVKQDLNKLLLAWANAPLGSADDKKLTSLLTPVIDGINKAGNKVAVIDSTTTTTKPPLYAQVTDLDGIFLASSLTDKPASDSVFVITPTSDTTADLTLNPKNSAIQTALSDPYLYLNQHVATLVNGNLKPSVTGLTVVTPGQLTLENGRWTVIKPIEFSVVDSTQQVSNQPPNNQPPGNQPPTNNTEDEAPDAGSLGGKLFNTGMTVITENGVEQPVFYSQKSLQNPAVRSHWEDVVNTRKQLVEDHKAKTPLHQLVDWRVIEVPAALQKTGNLPMDPGLMRATVSRYLVARDKANKQDVLVIPLDHSLYVRPAILTALKQSGITTLKNIDTNALKTNGLVSLYDLLKTGGEDFYNWFKDNKYTGGTETYTEIMQKMHTFEDARVALTDIINNQVGNLFISQALELDGFNLQLFTSNPFPATLDDQYAIDKLTFNDVVEGRSLIVTMSRDEQGNIKIAPRTALENSDYKTPVMSEELYNYYFTDARLEKLISKEFWNNRFPGHYLLVANHNGNLLKFKMVNESGLELLLDKIRDNKAFLTQTEGFFVDARDAAGALIKDVELVGFNLDKSGKRQELSLKYKTNGITFYSSDINLKSIKTALEQSEEAGLAVLQAEINRVITTFKPDKTQPVDPAVIASTPMPVSATVQQGDKNLYNRKVRVQSPAVFQTVDINWSFKSLQPATPVPISTSATMQPVIRANPATPPAQTVSTSVITSNPQSQIGQVLRQLENEGVNPDLLKVIQERIINQGLAINMDLLTSDAFKEKMLKYNGKTAFKDLIFKQLLNSSTTQIDPPATTRLQSPNDWVENQVAEALKFCM